MTNEDEKKKKKILDHILFGVMAVVISIIAILFLFTIVNSDTECPEWSDDNSPVIYAYSNSCSYCVKQKDLLDDQCTDDIKLRMVSIDTQREIIAEYGIYGTPAFICTKTDRVMEGFHYMQDIKEFYEECEAA